MKQSFYFTAMADPKMAMDLEKDKKQKSKNKANETIMKKALLRLRQSSKQNLEK